MRLASQLKELDAQQSGQSSKTQRLEELLSKCKDRIASQKEHLQQLTAKNHSLLAEMDDHAAEVERLLSSEWKGRVDRLEEEWSTRLQQAEEKAALAIASSKAETHGQLQLKDGEIEKWINKCHTLEKADSDGNQRWQAKVVSELFSIK